MSVMAVAVVEFLGSVLALLVSLLFLQSDIELYRMSEKFVHIYGPASAFHFLDPAFYIVYMILPMLFGLLGIVCACGLLGLREWARKGTLFLATVPVLVCMLLVLFHPGAVFPPDPGQGAILALGGGVYLVLFVCLLVVLIPVSIWWQILLTRESVRSQFR
ncbi:MAG TPA: hypothetical protein VIX11_05945 [Candidatus Acidoferrum sp.]